MKASEKNLLRFLDGSHQFIVPNYQRKYSWTSDQCDQLWDDIFTVGTSNKPSHFLGSIVYIAEKEFLAAETIPLLLIDGQQRITSILLLLSAIGKLIEKEGIEFIRRQKIENRYIFNAEEENGFRYKLKLSKDDDDAFKAIMDGVEWTDAKKERSLLWENYDSFYSMLENSLDNIKTVYEGIKKLQIVGISLNLDYDNPQLIFESLNSTGLDLTQTDLIRNYILMDLKFEEQNKLYNNYWIQIERNFSEDPSLLDRFFRDFLTLKQKRIPKLKEIYIAFKDYLSSPESYNQTKLDIVKELFQYSNLYINFALVKEDNMKLKEIFQDINKIEIKVAFPLILGAYYQYHLKKIDADGYYEFLKIILSYVFRRAICGIPTNSLNKTFLMLCRDVETDDFINIIIRRLMKWRNYRRFPKDAEFIEAFQTKDVYSFRNCKYLLESIENHNKKERISAENYTIEHIMPQTDNLRSEWISDLGENWKEIHDTFLHVLGNLTLTGYNSELSDLPFLKKKSINGGFISSPIQLNHGILHLTTWNKEEIIRRTRELAQTAVNIWIFPEDILIDEIGKDDMQNDEDSDIQIEGYSDYETVGDFYYQFFTNLMREYKKINPRWRKRKISSDNYYGFSAGKSGLSNWWTFSNSNTFEIALGIDFGEKTKNQDYLEKILRSDQYKELIPDFLPYEPKARYRSLFISKELKSEKLSLSETECSELINWGILYMQKLRAFLNKFLKYK